jgi:hypothetical protein
VVLNSSQATQPAQTADPSSSSSSAALSAASVVAIVFCTVIGISFAAALAYTSSQRPKTKVSPPKAEIVPPEFQDTESVYRPASIASTSPSENTPIQMLQQDDAASDFSFKSGDSNHIIIGEMQ